MPFGNKDKSENAKTDSPKKAELPKDLPARTPAGPRGKGRPGSGPRLAFRPFESAGNQPPVHNVC